MSLAAHILITVSIAVIAVICLGISDFFNDDSKAQIKEELAEIKPLLSEDMFKRVSDDARRGSGIFARCITVNKKPLSIKDKVLIPVIGFCAIAFWPSIISTIFNLSWKETLGVAIVCVIPVLLILVDTAD